MSTEVISSGVATNEPIDSALTEIHERVRMQMELNSAVRNYVRNEERFESASIAFNESCQALRNSIKPNTTIVVRLDYGKHCLLTSDNEGNFEVNPVDVI